jgi:hypothetical protein
VVERLVAAASLSLNGQLLTLFGNVLQFDNRDTTPANIQRKLIFGSGFSRTKDAPDFVSLRHIGSVADQHRFVPASASHR